MARINQGFLGDASGKLGNVVFAKWRDIQTARLYQPNINDANSPAQRNQRTKMLNILRFLKPLNKNFIKFYNSAFAKGSTPWAKAIKDNKDIFTNDGCFTPENFALGVSDFNSPSILEAIYDPFIDAVIIKYNNQKDSSENQKFPYTANSALLMHKPIDGIFSFNTQNLINFQPENVFCSKIVDVNLVNNFQNFCQYAFLWSINYPNYDTDSIIRPVHNLSAAAFIQPIPIFKGFNNDIKENLFPSDAINWEYQFNDPDWQITAYFDPKKYQIKDYSDLTIFIFSLAFVNGKFDYSDPMEWNLSENPLTFDIGPDGLQGSVMLLFTVVDADGKQISAFNRFYVDTGTDNITRPLFHQLFLSDYIHPSAFQLSDNMVGFVANVDELFPEFIEQYKQGLIKHNEKPYPPKNAILNISSNNFGSVTVINHHSYIEHQYHFYAGDTAIITLIPNENCSFLMWTGSDANNITMISELQYSIKMDSDKNLIANFDQKR